MFSFGIEHELAFLRADGKFADFTNTRYADLDQIVARLPVYPGDYPQLRVGDAGIKKKRWYIEGFERFQDSEDVIECVPKGIEIRTSVHTEIGGVVKELRESFNLLRKTAAEFGYKPALVSFNPFQKQFEPQPPLNEYERERRRASPEKRTAEIPMMTYGPDLNISVDGLSTDQIIDAGKKWTYYSPYILPFSYSAPFFQGGLWGAEKAWGGYSIRTYLRTGKRPAAMVFLADQADLIKSNPSLTKIARVEREAGRIEFKAFDSCGDFRLYAALLALLKGLLLDKMLEGRALVPDAEQHKLSARWGFEDEGIYAGAQEVFEASRNALGDDSDGEYLALLEKMLEERVSPAHLMIERFGKGEAIEGIMSKGYGELDGWKSFQLPGEK